MPQNSGINIILRSDKTVFSFKEILALWGETSAKTNTNTNASSTQTQASPKAKANAKAKLNYYIKTGRLYHIRKGIYAKDKNYNKLELADKIFKPSYISLETVLSQEGLIPRQNKNISAITYQTRTILCDKQAYEFKKIKNSILTNPLGIIQKNNYAIASKEKALLDALYLNKDYHFDNLNSVDWEKCFDMAEIYKNKSLGKRLYDIYESFKYN